MQMLVTRHILKIKAEVPPPPLLMSTLKTDSSLGNHVRL